MKKGNKKRLALGLAMLLAMGMALVMMPAVSGAIPEPNTFAMSGNGSSKPVDGHILSVMSVGGSSYILAADGVVYSFGQGSRGELGDGIGQDGKLTGISEYQLPNNATQALPVRKWSDGSILKGIDRLYGGLYFTIFAYDADADKLYAWGQNGNHRIDNNGQVWEGAGDVCEEYNKAKPVGQLPDGFHFQGGQQSLAVGRYHVALIDEDGKVWTYGNAGEDFRLGYTLDQSDANNTYYDVGMNLMYTTKARQVPLSYNVDEKAIAVSIGNGAENASVFPNFTYALTNLGRVFSWGGKVFAGFGATHITLDQPDGAGADFEYTKLRCSQGGNALLLGSDGKVYYMDASQLGVGVKSLFWLQRWIIVAVKNTLMGASLDQLQYMVHLPFEMMGRYGYGVISPMVNWARMNLNLLI